MAKSIAVLLCQPRLVIVLFEVGLTGCVSVSAGSALQLFSETSAKLVKAVKRKELVVVVYMLGVALFIHFSHTFLQ